MAKLLVKKLESGNIQAGVEHARQVNQRWCIQSPSVLHREWSNILANDWSTIREKLLDESERGAKLRQNNPFCGILNPQERWAFLREYDCCES